METEETKKSSIKDFLLIAITSLVVVFLVRTYLAQPFIVDGASMEPTFHTGDYLIVDQLSYNFTTPKRFDVVVFHTEFIPGGGEREYYIKTSF